MKLGVDNCEIIKEQTQMSLAFHDESARTTKENKTRVYVIQSCVSSCLLQPLFIIYFSSKINSKL